MDEKSHKNSEIERSRIGASSPAGGPDNEDASKSDESVGNVELMGSSVAASTHNTDAPTPAVLVGTTEEDMDAEPEMIVEGMGAESEAAMKMTVNTEAKVAAEATDLNVDAVRATTTGSGDGDSDLSDDDVENMDGINEDGLGDDENLDGSDGKLGDDDKDNNEGEPAMITGHGSGDYKSVNDDMDGDNNENGSGDGDGGDGKVFDSDKDDNNVREPAISDSGGGMNKAIANGEEILRGVDDGEDDGLEKGKGDNVDEKTESDEIEKDREEKDVQGDESSDDDMYTDHRWANNESVRTERKRKRPDSSDDKRNACDEVIEWLRRGVYSDDSDDDDIDDPAPDQVVQTPVRNPEKWLSDAADDSIVGSSSELEGEESGKRATTLDYDLDDDQANDVAAHHIGGNGSIGVHPSVLAPPAPLVRSSAPNGEHREMSYPTLLKALDDFNSTPGGTIYARDVTSSGAKAFMVVRGTVDETSGGLCRPLPKKLAQVVANEQEFAASSMHYYEVLLSVSPYPLRIPIDVDVYKVVGAHNDAFFDRDTVERRLWAALQAYVSHELRSLNLAARSFVTTMSLPSEGSEKFSLHAVLTLALVDGDDAHHGALVGVRGICDAGVFMRRFDLFCRTQSSLGFGPTQANALYGLHRYEIEEELSGGDGGEDRAAREVRRLLKYRSIFDLAIYTKNRSFRTYGSTKYGQRRPLRDARHFERGRVAYTCLPASSLKTYALCSTALPSTCMMLRYGDAETPPPSTNDIFSHLAEVYAARAPTLFSFARGIGQAIYWPHQFSYKKDAIEFWCEHRQKLWIFGRRLSPKRGMRFHVCSLRQIYCNSIRRFPHLLPNAFHEWVNPRAPVRLVNDFDVSANVRDAPLSLDAYHGLRQRVLMAINASLAECAVDSEHDLDTGQEPHRHWRISASHRADKWSEHATHAFVAFYEPAALFGFMSYVAANADADEVVNAIDFKMLGNFCSESGGFIRMPCNAGPMPTPGAGGRPRAPPLSALSNVDGVTMVGGVLAFDAFCERLVSATIDALPPSITLDHENAWHEHGDFGALVQRFEPGSALSASVHVRALEFMRALIGMADGDQGKVITKVRVRAMRSGGGSCGGRARQHAIGPPPLLFIAGDQYYCPLHQAMHSSRMKFYAIFRETTKVVSFRCHGVPKRESNIPLRRLLRSERPLLADACSRLITSVWGVPAWIAALNTKYMHVSADEVGGSRGRGSSSSRGNGAVILSRYEDTDGLIVTRRTTVAQVASDYACCSAMICVPDGESPAEFGAKFGVHVGLPINVPRRVARRATGASGIDATHRQPEDDGDENGGDVDDVFDNGLVADAEAPVETRRRYTLLCRNPLPLWIQHARHCMIRGEVYRPDLAPNQVDAQTQLFNRYTGFAVDPMDDGMSDAQIVAAFARSRIHEFLRYIVSDSDESFFEFMLRWLASIARHPARKTEVALVLLGRKGSGKTTFFQLIKRLFGHMLIVEDYDRITQQFNAHLRDILFLALDECVYGGDKKHSSLLKSLITSDCLFSESKNSNETGNVPNYMNVIITSDGEWVIPATEDARRFAVKRVSDVMRGDADYWSAFYSAVFEDAAQYELRVFLTYLQRCVPLTAGWRAASHVPRQASDLARQVMLGHPLKQRVYELLSDALAQRSSITHAMKYEKLGTRERRFVMHRELESARNVDPRDIPRLLSQSTVTVTFSHFASTNTIGKESLLALWQELVEPRGFREWKERFRVRDVTGLTSMLKQLFGNDAITLTRDGDGSRPYTYTIPSVPDLAQYFAIAMGCPRLFEVRPTPPTTSKFAPIAYFRATADAEPHDDVFDVSHLDMNLLTAYRRRRVPTSGHRNQCLYNAIYAGLCEQSASLPDGIHDANGVKHAILAELRSQWHAYSAFFDSDMVPADVPLTVDGVVAYFGRSDVMGCHALFAVAANVFNATFHIVTSDQTDDGAALLPDGHILEPTRDGAQAATMVVVAYSGPLDCGHYESTVPLDA